MSRFWKRTIAPIMVEPPTAVKIVSEPIKERGYFESIAAADIVVDTPFRQEPIKVDGAEQAMRLATVYRCTSILSGSIASLPLQLKRKKQGCFMVDEDNPMNYLLSRSPNFRQTAFELIRNAIIQMVNAGNAYIYPDWKEGELDSLTLLSPGSVSYDKILNIYLVSDPVNNIFKVLECDEIIHLRNMSLDGGYTGVSTIRYASKVMSITASANAQSLDVFQPGSTYAGFISGNSEEKAIGYQQYNETQLKDVSDRIRQALKSGERINYMPGDMKFNPLSMSPADIQLMEIMKFGVLELCRFYGVHPDKAFAGQSANYKASEMSQVQFMTDTLQPLLRQIENEFFIKLIPRSLASKYRIEFDLEAFYQTDLVAMSTDMEKCIMWGVNTVNERRSKKGYAPIEGGDVPMISCNVAPLKSAENNRGNVKTEINLKETDKNSEEVPPV